MKPIMNSSSSLINPNTKHKTINKGKAKAINKSYINTNKNNIKPKLSSTPHPQLHMNKTITIYPNITLPKPNSIEEKNLITEKELLIQERYQLKIQINTLNEELSKYKTENVSISLQLSQRERELYSILSANEQQKEKILQSIIVSKMKAKHKEQAEELKQKDEEIHKLQQSKGHCNENELKIKNEHLTKELSNLAQICQYSTNAMSNVMNNENELTSLKEMVTQQHGIIGVLEEKLKTSERNGRLMKKEVEEVKKKFEAKNVAICKLENDNKKLREFIKKSLRDEVGMNEWANEKKEYNRKVKELEDNANHYKSLYVNNKENRKGNNSGCGLNETGIIELRPRIQSINNTVNAKHPEDSIDKQILLLKSIIKELRTDNQELKATLLLYEEQGHDKNRLNIKPGIQNKDKDKDDTISYNTAQVNIQPNTNIDLQFEDILLINLSAKNINQSNVKQFFSSIINEDNINESSQEELITQITNTLSIMLNCSNNQKDKDALFSFFNAMYSSDDIDDLCDNFYLFFTKVNSYDYDQDKDEDQCHQIEVMTNNIKKTLVNHIDLVHSLLKNFPKTITIQNMISIFRKNGVVLDKESLMYLCYEMKLALALESLINKDGSLMDLKTAKLEEYIQLKSLEENLGLNDIEEDEEHKDKDKDKGELNEEEEDQEIVLDTVSNEEEEGQNKVESNLLEDKLKSKENNDDDDEEYNDDQFEHNEA